MFQSAPPDGQARFLHLKSVSIEDPNHEAKFTVVLRHRADFKETFKSEKKTQQVTMECNTYAEVTTTAELAVQSSHTKFDFRLDLSAAHKEHTHVDPASGITVTVSFGECITGSEVAHRRLEYAMSALQKHESTMGKLKTCTQNLEFVVNVGVVLSEFNPVAKAVVVIVSEMFKQIKQIPEDYREHCAVIQDMLSVLPTSDEAWEKFNSPNVQRVLQDFVNIMVEALQELIECDKQSKKVFWTKSILASKKGDIEKLKNAISRVESGMGLAFMTEIQDGVSHNLRKTEDVEAELRLLRLKISSEKDRELLEKLMPPDNSTHDGRRCCLPGTRMSVLEKLVQWAGDDNSSSRLYWVYGVAGCGKSSIASSIAGSLEEQMTLAGSFFCKRDIPERRDPVRLIQSLALYIAHANRHFGIALLDILRKPHTLVNKSLPFQFAKLIKDPLSRLKECTVPAPIILVVDALDECEENEDVSESLARMVQLVPWLRIIVTSRNVSGVHAGLDGVDEPREELDLFREDTQKDILTYLRHQFSRKGLLKELESYVEERQIKALADRAQGLFIWIDTVLKYVSSRRVGKLKLLEELVTSKKAGNAEKGLDALYRHVLENVAQSSLDGKNIVRLVVGIIFMSSKNMPLPANTLHNFMPSELHVLPSEFKAVLEDLSPVLIQDTFSEAVRAYHPSFLDFIENEERSVDYWTDGPQLEAIMAKACFRIMECGSRCDERQGKALNGGLRFNICQLETSYLTNEEVTDLEERISANISPELQYSAIFWHNHLLGSNVDTEIRDMLKVLLGTPRALYWLEAMSLMDRLGLARYILKCLPEEDKFALDDGEMRNVISELNYLVKAFDDVIERSTPHMYTSVMEWIPSGSVLRERWSLHFSRPQIVSRHIVTWPSSRRATLRTLLRRSIKKTKLALRQVAYSPDGTRIISGAHNYTLRIRGARIGAPIGESLKGHEDDVNCVVYSPDGTRIVSGSDDGTLRMWDGQNGSPIGELLRKGVWCVAYSPDGTRIVSGSKDGTLQMWDGQSGTPVGEPVKGHTDWIRCVAYSPDGTRIISVSGNATLRMWDGQSGAPIDKPLKGHMDDVYCVAYSPDGLRIVSGSWDGTLRMWDGKSGAPVGESLKGHADWVTCVTYSPDGTRIVSGSDDGTLRMWDGQSGAPVGEPREGHTSMVCCVAYSPDGKRIISSSRDGTLRMWDARSGAPVTDSPWGESRWGSERQCFVSTSELTTLGGAERPPPAHPPVPLCVPSDGWIRTLHGDRLLWIPKKYRNDICDLACMPENAADHLVGIDWKNLYHGENWNEIYRE